MRKILAICLFELKRILKQPSTYILMLAMPLLFSFLFGSMFTGDTEKPNSVALVNEDHSLQARFLIQQLENNDAIHLEILEADEARKALNDKKTEGVFWIRSGFGTELADGKDPKLKFQYPPSSATAQILKQVVNQSIQTMVVQMNAAKAWRTYSGEDWLGMFQMMNDRQTAIELPKSKLISIDGKEQETKLTGTSYSSPGFTIMFVMIMMLIVTGVFIEARKSGVWQRMMSVPTSRLQIVIGYLLSFFLIGWIQFGLLMISSSVLFDVNWGNLGAATVLISALLLAIVGLGLMIAGFAKTTEQQGTIGSLVIISTCMLGGVYWPVSIVPEFMQKIAQFTPQFWAMKGFTRIISDQGGITDIWYPVLILLGFAVVFLMIGLSRVKYEV